MYPLLLSAPLKDYLWGGNRLKDEFGFTSDKEKIAEAWVLSSHKDGQSVVLNGKLKGKTLSEAIEVFGQDCLGENTKKFPYFPLLIKLIDAKDKLSVQVHPDDEYALKNEGEFGKTEMWYIVDCEEDAKLIYGLNKEVTQDELNEKIENDTITDICNFVPVKKGDVFFIKSGTLHAIGKGILIAEIQQNSNTTYRVSDYGRLGADGKPRQLHKKQASEVIDKKPTAPYKKATAKTTSFGTLTELAKCKFFTANLIDLDGATTVKNEKSFVSLLVLSGKANLSYQNETLELKKGSSVFVPADFEVKISGKAEIIVSNV
ncbi:MAG: class I mannose-6-phosphate isomerase [Clostridia bacterium]|nr:class I mannose-6-phosphate isomerase [Clostridia bacterium]